MKRVILLVIVVALVILFLISKPYSNGVPKIIHQTAPRDKTKWNPIWEPCQKTWRLHFPDYEYRIVITTEPKSNPSNVAKDLTFKVVAKSDPSGDTLSYRWQVNNGGWANVANVAGKYSNNTSPTFTANNLLANGRVVFCARADREARTNRKFRFCDMANSNFTRCPHGRWRGKARDADVAPLH